jgi:hypothetical protein
MQKTGLREYFTRLVADTITISVKLGVEVVGKHIRITNGTDRTTYTSISGEIILL